MDPIEVVVEATKARMTAQQEAADQLARRRLGLWQMHHDQHLSVADIALQVRGALLAAGVTTDQLRNAGVGYESITQAVRGPRPEGAQKRPVTE